MNRHQPQPPLSRTAFTLVEMMVAVTLVMIMMLMFSTVFQIASGTMTTQRGIAVNDQKARTLSTILRADLKNRTFRYLVPYAANEPEPLTTIPSKYVTRREGYFYVSENDPHDDSDDVLQLTIKTVHPVTDEPEPGFGRAVALGIPESATAWTAGTYQPGDWVRPTSPTDDTVYWTGSGGDTGPTEPIPWGGSGSTVTDGTITWRGFKPSSKNRNQPEWDDGIGGNSSGASEYAEVAYFLRNGILYRRLQLIRLPADSTAEDDPKTSDGFDFFKDRTNGFYTGNFLGDFDYSVFRDEDNPDKGVLFHGATSLNNTSSGPKPLGRPQNRFGFNHTNHLPLEYLSVPNTGAPTNFIGRYTHEETSHPEFLYPQTINGPHGNPLRRNPDTGGTPWNISNSRQVVSVFNDGQGSRKGEDILMLNVHSFDVKVWDGGLSTFVDIGHDEVDSLGNPGHFNQQRNAHVTNSPQLRYGPANDVNFNRVFDTWHRELDLTSAATGFEPPPFRPDTGGATPVPIPLGAIQITIRYHDPKSDQLRQLTIQESLLD